MTTQTQPFRGKDAGIILAGSLVGMAAFVLLHTWNTPDRVADLLLSGIGRDVQAVVHTEASTMGLPLAGETSAYWYMARAGGMVAYLLLWLATFWGVAMSSKLTQGLVKAGVVFAFHEFLPLLAVMFAILHAGALLGDSYFAFSLVDLLIPFSGPYKPLWTGLGGIAFYLSIALVASFYVRSYIGRRAWRAFHYLAYVAFLLAMVHGITAGSDSSQPLVWFMYLLTGSSILFATFFRLFTLRRPAPKRSLA